MNKSVMYFLVLLQAIFSTYALHIDVDRDWVTSHYFLRYDNVEQEHKILIEEIIFDIFDYRVIEGSIKLIPGGMSGDGLYLFELDQVEDFKNVFRCMKQPHSIALCQRDCIYAEMAAKNGLGPEVLYQNIEKGCYLTEFVQGVHLSSAHLEDEQILEQLADALSTIHNGSIDSSIKFDIFERIEQKIKSALQKNPEFSLELNVCLEEVHKIKTTVKKPTIVPKACHNDIHSLNLFYTPENRINFIDWGNGGLGDPFWDLACSSIKLHFSYAQRDIFLQKYFKGNCTRLDRAHFLLMETIVLWEVWLYYLSMKEKVATDGVKSNVFNYFRKINEEVTDPIGTFEDLAALCFGLIQKRMGSCEYKEAFHLLGQP